MYPESYFENYDFTKLVQKKKLEYENSSPETDSMSFSDLDHHINYSQHSEFQVSTNPRESVSYYWSSGYISNDKSSSDSESIKIFNESVISTADAVSGGWFKIDDRHCYKIPKKLDISTISYAKALGYSCRLLKYELDSLDSLDTKDDKFNP